ISSHQIDIHPGAGVGAQKQKIMIACQQLTGDNLAYMVDDAPLVVSGWCEKLYAGLSRNSCTHESLISRAQWATMYIGPVAASGAPRGITPHASRCIWLEQPPEQPPEPRRVGVEPVIQLDDPRGLVAAPPHRLREAVVGQQPFRAQEGVELLERDA